MIARKGKENFSAYFKEEYHKYTNKKNAQVLAAPFLPVLISGLTVYLSTQLKHQCLSNVSKDTSEMYVAPGTLLNVLSGFISTQTLLNALLLIRAAKKRCKI